MEQKLASLYEINFLKPMIEQAFENGVVWFGELEEFVKEKADEFISVVEDEFPEVTGYDQWVDKKLKEEDWCMLFDNVRFSDLMYLVRKAHNKNQDLNNFYKLYEKKIMNSNPEDDEYDINYWAVRYALTL